MKLLSIFILGFLISCSNLSKNMVKDGSFTIKNGHYGNSSFSEELNFQRISWFHELTLLYDVMLVNIDEESKFNTWFSEDELQRVRVCKEKMVTLSYSLDSERISHSMFYSTLRDNGYEQYSVPNFSRALRTHPDFEQLSLTLYKVNFFCRKEKRNDSFVIRFPNFKDIEIN